MWNLKLFFFCYICTFPLSGLFVFFAAGLKTKNQKKNNRVKNKCQHVGLAEQPLKKVSSWAKLQKIANTTAPSCSFNDLNMQNGPNKASEKNFN